MQEGRRPTLEETIEGTITDYAGVFAYMEIGALRRLMREGGTISGEYLAVDMNAGVNSSLTVKEAPRLAGSASRKQCAPVQKEHGDMIGW